MDENEDDNLGSMVEFERKKNKIKMRKAWRIRIFGSRNKKKVEQMKKRRKCCMHATLCKKWHGLFRQVDPKKRQVKVTPCLKLVEPKFHSKPSFEVAAMKGDISQKFSNLAPQNIALLGTLNTPLYFHTS
jgi:hypothetical protein